jgi:hypothetical protein
MELDKTKDDMSEYCKLMRENNENLKRASDKIESSMKDVAVVTAIAVKDEIFAEINKTNIVFELIASNLDETISLTDYNNKLISKRLNTVERFMTTIDLMQGNQQANKFKPVEGPI